MSEFESLIIVFMVLYILNKTLFLLERIRCCKKYNKNCMKCKNWECDKGNLVAQLYKQGKYIVSEEERLYLENKNKKLKERLK